MRGQSGNWLFYLDPPLHIIISGYEMKVIGITEKEDLIDIICDICGKSTKTEFGDYEYAELSARWGYSSSRDEEYHEVCLCEKCYDQVTSYIESLGGKVSIKSY